MTTYRSCFGLQVDTSTSLSYNCYYDMEGDDFDIPVMSADTVRWTSRIEGDTDNDLIEIQDARHAGRHGQHYRNRDESERSARGTSGTALRVHLPRTWMTSSLSLEIRE
eukprot:5209420-Amphidinium_carterae.2